MLRITLGTLLLGLSVLSLHAADDALVVKVREPQAGDRVRVTDEEKSTSVSTFTVNGNKTEKTEKKSRAVVYVEDVLTAGEPGARRPAKVKRAYEKFESTKDGGEPEKGPLQGKTVLIEKKGEKYEFAYDGGGAVEASVAAALDREFNKAGSVVRTADVVPAKPVKVGDTWTVDKAKLLKDLSADGTVFDADKTTATAKLVKSFIKDDQRFGVIELKLETPIKTLAGKTPLEPKAGSVVILTVTVEGPIDGSVGASVAESRGTYKIEASTMGVDVKVAAEAEQIIKRDPLPKKP